MLRAYRLVYLRSPHARPTLWEWTQPHIDHLVLNARSFQSARIVQRYFRNQAALERENDRIWETHYRPYPLFDHLSSWPDWLVELRQIVIDVQALYRTQRDEVEPPYAADQG